MKKSDKERLKKIVATWESLKAEMHKRGITPELLLEDEFSQWAVTTPLYNIGEQVYQLSPEFKASYPEQPWNMVAGLRHRLVHDYDGINWSIIVEVLFEDMEPFVTAVNAILAGSSTGTAGSGCGPLPCSSAPWTGQNTPMPRRNIALNCRRSPAPPGTDAVKRIHFYFGFTETFSDFLYCKSLHKAL